MFAPQLIVSSSAAASHIRGAARRTCVRCHFSLDPSHRWCGEVFASEERRTRHPRHMDPVWATSVVPRTEGIRAIPGFSRAPLMALILRMGSRIMPRCTALARFLPALFMAGLSAACGGDSVGESAGSGKDSGTGGTDGGSACVNIEVVPSDLSCGSDQECELVRTGKVCNGQCSCGDTPVNAASATRFQFETASLSLEGCPCAFEGEARCLGGQCTLCGLGPNQPAGCGDAETTTVEDGGIVTVDGGGSETGTDSAMESGDSAGTCSGTNFCACTNFCVSTCRCGDGGCPLTQACGGAVCPNSCPSGEACAGQPGDVYMCSPSCTPDGVDGQGSCSAGMTCQTVCT
jgi:hypothetical protein